MNEKSNLTELQTNSTAVKSELAELVDRQLEARGTATYPFDEKEVRYTRAREFLNPQFYYGTLQDCGLDFWMVFKYAVHYLYDETGEKRKEKHPVGVTELFTILTGETDFMSAVQIFFMEVYPTHAREWQGVKPLFAACCHEIGRWHPIQPVKEYFIYELTAEKLRKLEIAMENANAMKTERFKLFDQFAERQDGNMDKIQKLISNLGSDAKEMIFPLLLNELRVNPSDVFRYFYHKDLALSMVWGGSPGKDRGGDRIKGRLQQCQSENFETFLKMTGVVSYVEIFSKAPTTAKHTYLFWKELQDAMKTSLPDRTASGDFYFPGIDAGNRGQGLWGDALTSVDWSRIHREFYDCYWKVEPTYLISTYGAEATKDRLDAIFTPEVLEIIWRDYGQFVFAPNKKEVEKEMKKLKEISSAEGGKPAQKKGLFGLFKKG